MDVGEHNKILLENPIVAFASPGEGWELLCELLQCLQLYLSRAGFCLGARLYV